MPDVGEDHGARVQCVQESLEPFVPQKAACQRNTLQRALSHVGAELFTKLVAQKVQIVSVAVLQFDQIQKVLKALIRYLVLRQI